MNFVLSLILGCSNPQVTNQTTEWNQIDSITLRSAIKRCPELYHDAPCLKRFIKKEENNYWAICGAKRK
jgi:hypothetical protein